MEVLTDQSDATSMYRRISHNNRNARLNEISFLVTLNRSFVSTVGITVLEFSAIASENTNPLLEPNSRSHCASGDIQERAVFSCRKLLGEIHKGE
jgi:hypothetical protein